MSKKNIPLRIILLFTLVLALNCWDYESNGEDWPASCKEGDQGPIDISPPFTYQPFELLFNYAAMNTEYLLYHDSNNLILEGDFGYITHNDVIYSSSQISFFNPSIHSFKSKKYPLEMQVIHQDEKGNKITLCVLFKESQDDYSIILGKIGFDEKSLQTLEPLKKISIKNKINLSKYISNEKDFFSYESLEATPPCEKKESFYILTDILNVNSNQLANFPVQVKNKFRTPQPRNDRLIFITIPVDQFAAKVLENRKILEENEQRMIKNEQLEKISETHNEDDSSAPPSDSNKGDCDELESIVPFELVKQRILAKEKYTKKADIKLLRSSSHFASNKTMKIDKEIPQNEMEIEREELKSKYSKWKEMYQRAISGKETEQDRVMIMFQMKKIEKELKEKQYQPYLNYMYRVNNYRSPDSPTSFIQINNPKASQTINDFINEKIQKEELESPYSFPEETEDSDTESDTENFDTFEITSWPIDCKRAEYRSPINIDFGSKAYKKNIPLAINLSQPKGKLFVNNDGYKIIVIAEEGFGEIQYYDHKFTAKRIALHYPSEHTFSKKEKRFDFEMQIISYDEFDSVAALSFLFEKGEQDFEFLNGIGFDAPNNLFYIKKIRSDEKVEIKNTEEVRRALDLSFINEQKKDFISYIGTTTTPPCKTNVRWFISNNIMKISQKQIEMFPILYGRLSNIREKEKVNDRNLIVIG